MPCGGAYETGMTTEKSWERFYLACQEDVLVDDGRCVEKATNRVFRGSSVYRWDSQGGWRRCSVHVIETVIAEPRTQERTFA
jgi:hypothetical protein